jgi:hypothetical protein
VIERKKQSILKELDSIRVEKEKLSKWLLGTNLTAQTVNYLNNQVDKLTEQESRTQERLWVLEDKIGSISVITYDAATICHKLTEFVLTFSDLNNGEPKLLVESLVTEV